MIKLEDLNINNLKIYQDANGFRFGTDAVLLALFSCKKKSVKICDLCSGCGIIPVLLSAMTKADKIYGIEIDPDQTMLSKKTSEFNKLTDRVSFINKDIRDIKNEFTPGYFDLVTANPPYMSVCGNTVSLDARNAKAEFTCTVNDLVSSASYLLKNGGRLCVIYKADRITDVLCSMRQYCIEPKQILFVQSKPFKSPYVFLCEGIKGGKPGTNVQSPLIIMNNKGEYTNEFKRLYDSAFQGR